MTESSHRLRKRTRLWLALWVWGPGQFQMAKLRGIAAPGGDKPQATEKAPPPFLSTHCQWHWEALSANKTGQQCLDKLACSMPSGAECQTLPTAAIGTTFHGYTARSSSVLTSYSCLRLWMCACVCVYVPQLCRHAFIPTFKVWVQTSVLWLMQFLPRRPFTLVQRRRLILTMASDLWYEAF